jgi:hypothetical protein
MLKLICSSYQQNLFLSILTKNSFISLRRSLAMLKTGKLYLKSVLLALVMALIMPLLSACNSGSSGTTATVVATTETEIYNNGNLAAVVNNPTGGPTTFAITGNYKVTLITDYHWNNGQGANAGTIGLQDANGKVLGTWPVTVRSGVYWDVQPNSIIGPGTYTVIDSNPSTWAQNSQSKNLGITDIKGLAVTYAVNSKTQNPTAKATQGSTGALYDDSYNASQEDIKAGNKAVADAANAIQTKDTNTFTSLMSSEVLATVKGSPDLNSPTAISLAEGLRNAKIIKAEKDCFVYETKVNSTDITFLVIKEDGIWKISGL